MTTPNKIIDGVEYPLSEDELAEWQDRQNDAPHNMWANVRANRNALLAASDWTQIADAPVDALAWAVYRQELRDITLQPDPFNITWPQEPA